MCVCTQVCVDVRACTKCARFSSIAVRQGGVDHTEQVVCRCVCVSVRVCECEGGSVRLRTDLKREGETKEYLKKQRVSGCV